MPSDSINLPFAEHTIAAGAIRYVFPDGLDIHELVRRFIANRSRGEIIGREGTGKTTLTEEFIAQFPPGTARVVELSRTRPGMPSGWAGVMEMRTGNPILVIDGAECLGPLRYAMVRTVVKMRGWGLLAVSRYSLGLPPLYRTDMTPELARSVMGRILNRPGSEYIPSDAELEIMINRHDSNLREIMLEIYRTKLRQRGEFPE